MDYDLRGRIEAFANGNCSPDAFIKELSTHCADSPDFVWEVLALVDQYHRRGKISLDFRRSVKELIERPALTRRAPAFAAPPPKPPSVVSMSLVAVKPSPAPAPQPAAERPVEVAEPTPKEATVVAQASSSTPHWATEGQIVLPVLHEYRPPDHKEAAPEIVHSNLVAALTAEHPRVPASSPACAPQPETIVPPAVAQPAYRRRSRSRPGRTLLVAAVAVAVTCVTASTALDDLATGNEPGALPAQATAPIQPAAISFSTDRFIAYPGSNSVVVEVARKGDTSREARFTWWTRSSSAKSGQDYIGSRPQAGHIAAGSSSVQWTIPILPNPGRRHTELFYLYLGSAGRAENGATMQATVFVMASG